MNKLNNLAALHAFAAIFLLGHFDTARAQLTVTPNALTFTATVGGAAPPAQTFTVGGTAFTGAVSSVTWAQFTPSAGPAGTIVTVSINMVNAPTTAGVYSGQITIVSNTEIKNVDVSLTLTGGGGTSTLSTNPVSLTFSYPSGTAQQSVQLTTTQSSSITYTATPSSTQNWLQVAPVSGSVSSSSPATINVIINTQVAATLPPANYNGTVTFTAPNTSPFVLQVTLQVGSSSQLQVSPSSLSFFYQIGQGAPAQQNVTFTATGSSTIFFSATPIIDSGNTSWLSVAPVTGFAAPGAPATIGANIVNYSGLPQGVYQARIIVTPTSGGISPFSIPVSLTVSNNALLTATPASLSFNYQAGLPNPASQTVNLAASAGTINQLTATAATQSGGGWLAASLSQTTTPATLTVTATPSALGLSTGVYNGTVTVTSPSAGNTIVIQVTLNVTNLPLIVASPGAMSFAFQTGQAIPQGQTLRITSSSGVPIPVSYSVSTQNGGGWLTVTGSAVSTPADFAVSINAPQALAVGTYTGKITITSASAANNPLDIPVTLIISATALLTVSPNSISFSTSQGGAVLGPVPASVTSTDNSQIGYTATASAPWLVVSPTTGTTSPPVNLQVLALTTSLSPGTYSADITITATQPTSIANSPQKIPVTLRITSGNTIVASPVQMAFTQTVGGAVPPTQNLSVTSSGAAISVAATAVAATGGGWLTVTPSSGTTPATFTVKADGTNLSPGTYTGSVTLQSADASTVTVPITLTITQAPTASASPSSLSFTYVAGQTTPAQAVALSLSSGSGTYTATVNVSTPAGGSWLSAAPLTGSLPGTLTVSINPTNLAAGTYTGSISVTVTGASNTLSIPVSLTVTGTELVVNPATMGFNYQVGTPGLPPSQTVNVTTASGVPVQFTVTAAVTSGSTTWLTATPGSGQTPANLTVTANPANLPPGTYTGTITVRSTQVLGSPTRTVNVTLVVTQPAIQPTIQQVLHGASLDPTPLSPGLIFTIKGTQLGPTTPQGLNVTNGFVDTTLSTVRVYVDDIPCPLLYVSATQINAVAPYAIANRTTVRVQTEFQSSRSNTVNVSAIATAPGIFTGGTGRGQGAILNEDYSFNALTPTARNKVVAIYATGDGVENPPALDGLVTTVLRRPVVGVTATIAGIPALVEYAGAVPGLVAGVLQVNVRVPDGVPSGNVPVVIVAGGAQSQIGVTLNVQ